MNGRLQLLLNLALSFYLIGTILGDGNRHLSILEAGGPEAISHHSVGAFAQVAVLDFLRLLGSPSSDHSP